MFVLFDVFVSGIDETSCLNRAFKNVSVFFVVFFLKAVLIDCLIQPDLFNCLHPKRNVDI